MEKKQYKDHHLPFVRSQLSKVADLTKKILEPAGDYKKTSEGQRVFLFLFSKILEVAEGTFGPLFSIEEGEASRPFPLKWEGIINYLQKEKFISQVSFQMVYYDEPKFVKSQLSAFFDGNLTDGRPPQYLSFAHGDSLDLDDSLAKVIGEFLERYPLLFYREKDFIKGSLNDLAKNKKLRYLDICDLAGFSEEQKTRDRRFWFDEKSNFLWVKGKSALDEKTVLIPGQLIFWNYNFLHQNWQEPVLREANTNGAGGHCTLKKAILSGLYELIQRDGFLIYWLNKKGPPRIDPRTIESEPLSGLLKECERCGLMVHFLNTTSDLGIPSCICVIFDEIEGMPKISLGAGCGADWDRILMRSLEEAFSVHHWLRREKEKGSEFKKLDQSYQPFGDAGLDQMQRILIWADKNMAEKFQFFLAGKIEPLKEIKDKTPRFDSDDEEFDYLINKFKRLGKDYEVFYYQAEHQALKDLGYCSVKVVAPALVPLYLREVHASLGAGRLKEVPEKLGFAPAKEWNPWPHPFP